MGVGVFRWGLERTQSLEKSLIDLKAQRILEIDEDAELDERE